MAQAKIINLNPPEFIDVVVYVCPDGKTIWMPMHNIIGEVQHDYFRKVLNKWKQGHPEFIETPCTIAAANIKMPYKKYKEIEAVCGPGEFEFPKD